MLPDETLLHIFSYFNVAELCNISLVCSHWTRLGKDDTLWLNWNEKHFLIFNKSSTKDTYRQMYEQFGPFISCYARVKKVWNELEEWLIRNNTVVAHDLCVGADTDKVNKFVEIVIQKGEYLPPEFLCSLMIHDGQTFQHNNHLAGLFGGFGVYDYRVNTRLLSTNMMCVFPSGPFKRHMNYLPAWTKFTIPVASSYLAPSVYFLAKEDFSFDGTLFLKGSILHHTESFMNPVLESTSYIGWLESYLRDLQRGRYDVSTHGEIIRFSRLAEEGSDVTTVPGIRVQANALFVPPRSLVNPQSNFFCIQNSDFYGQVY